LITDSLGDPVPAYDFDLEARSVEVRRNYVDGKMTTPKNGSGRRVDVSLHLAETLRALQVERKKETLQKGWREAPPWSSAANVFSPGMGWQTCVRRQGAPLAWALRSRCIGC
jgi:hypothetical protein